MDFFLNGKYWPNLLSFIQFSSQQINISFSFIHSFFLFVHLYFFLNILLCVPGKTAVKKTEKNYLQKIDILVSRDTQ